MTQLVPETDLIDWDALNGVSGPLAVAVSGGGDSVALLHLLHRSGQFDLTVVTVDHQLRRESEAEAAGVRLMAHELGLPHTTLMWEKPPRKNIQDAARRARRQLISEWAAEAGVQDVALGHTADDQAETFLLRLARGSGVEGLSAMDNIIRDRGLRWRRPLLTARRERLRAYLEGLGITWVDDPSNDDATFDRIKMRRALGALNEAGISVPRIADTTKRLRSARAVLFTATRDLARNVATLNETGEIRIATDRFLAAQDTMKLRLLSEAIRFVAGAYYAPRAHSVTAIIDGLSDGTLEDGCLGGCIIRSADKMLVIRREPERTGRPVALGELWDDRWILRGPDAPGAEVAELGVGITQTPWRETGFARESLLSTPALWQGETLLAAPVAGLSNDYVAEFCPRNPFFSS